MPATYTLSQLAAATGLKPRTLQFWTSSHVLQPEASTLHGGPGTHRRYTERELALAAILAPINSLGLQIGTLRSISEYIRGMLTAGDDYGYTDPLKAEADIHPKKGKRAKLKLGDAEHLRLSCWTSIERTRRMDPADLVETAIAVHLKPDGTWDAVVYSNDYQGKDRKPIEIQLDKWPVFIVIDLLLIFNALLVHK